MVSLPLAEGTCITSARCSSRTDGLIPGWCARPFLSPVNCRLSAREEWKTCPCSIRPPAAWVCWFAPICGFQPLTWRSNRPRSTSLPCPRTSRATTPGTSPGRGITARRRLPDVDAADVQTLSEGQAWRKYALGGRIGLAGARAGVNVFLHGSLWDLGSNSGQSVVVTGDQTYETKSQEAALLNLWL